MISYTCRLGPELKQSDEFTVTRARFRPLLGVKPVAEFRLHYRSKGMFNVASASSQGRFAHSCLALEHRSAARARSIGTWQ